MKKSISICLLFLAFETLFAQNDFTPSWSIGVVWYQIFPDRFYNGDPSNDPKVTDQY